MADYSSEYVTNYSKLAVLAFKKRAVDMNLLFNMNYGTIDTMPEDSIRIPLPGSGNTTTFSGNSSSYIYDGATLTGATLQFDTDVLHGMVIQDKQHGRFHTDPLIANLGNIANKVVNKIINTAMANITNSNYSNKTTVTAAEFTLNEVNEALASITALDVPLEECVAVLSPAYYWALLKDAKIISASNFGNNSPVLQGLLEQVLGCKVRVYNNIPDNSENLKGFIIHKNALAVAVRPDRPQNFDNMIAYTEVMDQESGIIIGIRDFYENGTGQHVWSYALDFGEVKLLGDACHRIVSA